MGDCTKHRAQQWLLSSNRSPILLSLCRLSDSMIQQTPPTATWLALDWKSSASKGICSQYFSILASYRVTVKSNCTLFEQNMRQHLYRLLENLLEHMNTSGDTLYIRWVHIHIMKEEYVSGLQNVYNTT